MPKDDDVFVTFPTETIRGSIDYVRGDRKPFKWRTYQDGALKTVMESEGTPPATEGDDE